MYKHYSPTSYRALCGDTVPEAGLTTVVSLVSCPICLAELEKDFDDISPAKVVVSPKPATITETEPYSYLGALERCER